MPRGVRKDPVDEALAELGEVHAAMVVAKAFKTGTIDKKLLPKICELAVIGGKQKIEDLLGILHSAS